jgi:hypothetical protein
MRKPIAAALIVIALAAAGPASAGDEPRPAKDETVMMNPIGLPIVVDGQVVNYIFITLRLRLSKAADPNRVHEMEPFLRDALVRAGGRTPFVRPDNYAALDDSQVRRTIIAAADAVIGRGMVIGVDVVKEQAQHYQGLPKPSSGRQIIP